MFAWARNYFDLRTFHVVQAPLEFTREDWCGRIRACRGVGASLSTAEVDRFDAEHDRLLEAIAPDTFTVLHHMTLHVFVRKGSSPPSKRHGADCLQRPLLRRSRFRQRLMPGVGLQKAEGRNSKGFVARIDGEGGR
ncbi:MAG: hypothetical protein ACREYE_27070 [Gammaproteobacteria bacterium]